MELWKISRILGMWKLLPFSVFCAAGELRGKVNFTGVSEECGCDEKGGGVAQKALHIRSALEDIS